MLLQENSMKINKELSSGTLTKLLKFFKKKLEINGKTLKKINSQKSHKFPNYLKSIKTFLKSTNSLLHKSQHNKQKQFFMIVSKNCYKLKVIQTNLFKKARICLKGPNNFIKPVRKWTQNVVRSYDFSSFSIIDLKFYI